MSVRAPVWVPLGLSLLALAPACLEPPEIEPLPPPLADLGGLDTWEPLDLPSPGPDSGGPGSPGTNPDPAATSEGPAETGSDPRAPDPALFDLRLTEVLADPEGKDGALDGPEYIEVLNIGESPAKIGGLYIVSEGWPNLSASELGLAELELAPGQYLVVRRWTKDEDAALAEVESSVAALWSGFLHGEGLRNAEGFVALTTAAGDPIDGMVYGSFTDAIEFDWLGPGVAIPEAGQSACRVDASLDGDGPGDWSSCPLSPGSDASGALPTPDPIAPGALVIVEVAANPIGPSSDEKFSEYIELLNISENELELSGCRVSDATSLDVPGVDPLFHLEGEGGCESPTCLGPGRRALIVGDAYTGPTGEALVLRVDDSTIADGGLTNSEPVSIWNQADELVTGYRHWPDPSTEPLPPDGLALHRIEAGALDEPGAWMVAPASPGT